MKLITSIVLIFISITAFGQGDFNIGGNAVPCYEKAKLENRKSIDGWACGKVAGMVDCNDQLELDDNSGLIVKKAIDNMNLQGVGKPYSGGCESCHGNGLIARRINFVNGKENGIDTAFYASGCIQAIRSHIQGAESGQWLYYYDSTQQMAWEMNFYIGEKNGKHIYLKANGDTTKLENYKNGLLEGMRRTYFSGSRPFKEASYKNGLLAGTFKGYSPDGILLEEVNYKEGKKNGACKYFYDDGVLLKTENWTMDVKNGEFKMFYYQGHVQTLENFKNGVPFGKFEEYYPDQKLKRSALYDKKGVLLEEHKFDEIGNETYSFGAPTKSQAEDDELPGKKK